MTMEEFEKLFGKLYEHVDNKFNELKTYVDERKSETPADETAAVTMDAVSKLFDDKFGELKKVAVPGTESDKMPTVDSMSIDDLAKAIDEGKIKELFTQAVNE